jgi:hypothetical protein
MTTAQFEQFLTGVDLPGYRARYSHIKLVEMDLPKSIQAIALLYAVYWDERAWLSYEDFYQRYRNEKAAELEAFRTKITMCEDCFYRGLEARIYRTWAGLITQIHAGYVAESVFGPGTVAMSAELDNQGADIRVTYRGQQLNYQVKKDSYSGVMSRRPLARKKVLPGENIDIKYEVPVSLADPKTKSGEYRKPYQRFLDDTRTRALPNHFVIFTDEVFAKKKAELDAALGQ